MIQKIKKSDDSALSKNNGESVKYRIRKQEENEYEEAIREYFRESENSGGDREEQGQQPT